MASVHGELGFTIQQTKMLWHLCYCVSTDTGPRSGGVPGEPGTSFQKVLIEQPWGTAAAPVTLPQCRVCAATTVQRHRKLKQILLNYRQNHTVICVWFHFVQGQRTTCLPPRNFSIFPFNSAQWCNSHTISYTKSFIYDMAPFWFTLHVK